MPLQVRCFERLVVLDLDDTLYLERDYVESGLRAVGGWAQQQIGLCGLGAEMIRRFRDGSRSLIFDEALRCFGQRTSPPLIAKMLQVYRQHRPHIQLADDALRFLTRRPTNVGLAVITDGFLDAQKRKIRALGLHGLGLNLAVCTDRWGRKDWKPSTRAFLHVQTLFGMEASGCVYIADNPDKDFHAPRRLGWSTVQIRRPLRIHLVSGADAEQADFNVETLDDLTFYRDELRSGRF